ncbi:hypothetical protein M436DRAFT_25653, partial [Aureobasidium namibiae CBS 147.97]
SSPLDAATTFCSNINYHRSLQIPASLSHERLRVTYATTTNFEDETLPVVLFCHPMGAARYLIFGFEELATKEGVRVVIIDRPGFGGTTAVALDKRVQTWLEIVPAVLKVLRVKRVALMSHSAGTIYAFNTAVRLPHLMYPGGKAFMGCLAPWVHPTHSSAPLSQVIDKLPASWVGNLHRIQSFVNSYIAPSLAFSSAKLGVKPSLTEQESQRSHGMEAKTWDEVGKLQQKWRGMEDMSGVSADATLCMQREGKYWGVYASLPSCIDLLRSTYTPQDSDASFASTLTLRVYFAESDALIGRGGQKYFEQCWKEGNGDAEGRVRFEASVVQGADHDSIVLAEKGVLGDVFREVK